MTRKARIFIIVAVILAAVAAIVALYRGLWSIPTIPVGKGARILFNAGAFALYCLILCFSVISGRNKPGTSFRKALEIAVWCAFLGLAGKLADDYLIPEGNPAVLPVSIAVILTVFLAVYFKLRKREADKVSSTAIRKSAVASGQLKHTYTVLYGALTVMMAADIIHFAVTIGGDNWNGDTLIPLSATLLAVILWRLVKWRGILAFAVATDLLFAAKLIFGMQYVKAFSALGTSLAVSLAFVSVVLPLADLYCRKEENI